MFVGWCLQMLGSIIIVLVLQLFEVMYCLPLQDNQNISCWPWIGGNSVLSCINKISTRHISSRITITFEQLCLSF
jgi:hypothetical protein